MRKYIGTNCAYLSIGAPDRKATKEEIAKYTPECIKPEVSEIQSKIKENGPALATIRETTSFDYSASEKWTPTMLDLRTSLTPKHIVLIEGWINGYWVVYDTGSYRLNRRLIPFGWLDIEGCVVQPVHTPPLHLIDLDQKAAKVPKLKAFVKNIFFKGKDPLGQLPSVDNEAFLPLLNSMIILWAFPFLSISLFSYLLSLPRYFLKYIRSQQQEQLNIHMEEEKIFSVEEEKVLCQQFMKATSSGGEKVSLKKRVLSKSQFQNIMGVLGLESASFLSDRIYKAINLNGDGKIRWNEFLQMMNILANGTTEEKSRFGFRILDIQGDGFLRFEHFKIAINEIVRFWYALTATTVPLTDDILMELFERIDQKEQGYIKEEDYIQLVKDKLEFVPWFDLLNAELLSENSDNKKKKQQITYQLDMVKQQLIWVFQLVGTSQKGVDGNILLSSQIRHDVLNRTEYAATAINTIKQLIQTPTERRRSSILEESPTIGSHSNEFQEAELIKDKKEIGNVESQSNLRRSILVRNKTKNEDKGFVTFMDQNWNLVLNMMLGIRNAIKSLPPVAAQHELKPTDYTDANTYELVHLRTDKEQETAYHFVDYSGFVFQKIRELYGIKNEDYLREIGLEQLIGNLMVGNLSSLKEQCSCGKSGSFFYYSSCGRFLMKTIPHGEFATLRSTLELYYNHLLTFQNTLLTRFFGLHQIQNKKQKSPIYFVIMANIFNTSRPVHVRYDLKGSIINREVRKTPKDIIDPNISLKDIDFAKDNQNIQISPYMKLILLKQLELDSAFLKDLGICDYSLLIGIHNFDQKAEDIGDLLCDFNNQILDYSRKIMKNPYSGDIRLQPFNELNDGGIISGNGSKLFFIGIIDTLTYYGAGKKVEHYWKTIKNRKGTEISAVAPEFYSKRFIEYTKSIIL